MGDSGDNEVQHRIDSEENQIVGFSVVSPPSKAIDILVTDVVRDIT